MKTFAVLFFLLPAAGYGVSEAASANWSGRYSPCHRHADLLSSGHVDLGVRILTSNELLAEQFARAMEFWSGVLDIDWHPEASNECAIQVVDGTPSLFNFCVCLSARAQSPDQPEFQGWIAFNPRMKLSRDEMFFDSVHEIGHLLGLQHNQDETSIMFYFGLERVVSLNAADLRNLASRHQLRRSLAAVVPVVAPQ